MSSPKFPVAVAAEQAPARTKPTNYPEPFASRMAGRLKRPLGDLFGLKNFGVNLTRLMPAANPLSSTVTASRMSLSIFSKAGRR